MTGNTSRRKGARWETEVVNYLRANGFPYAERRPPGQPIDRGDILGIAGVVIECKNQRQLAPGAWIDQATQATHNTHADLAVVIAKRHGHPNVEDALAIMRTDHLLQLLHETNGAQTP